MPLLIGADGPKGRAVAAEIGDGVFGSGTPPIGDELPSWRGVLTFGTVLGDNESLSDERVMDAAGHALAVVYHGAYERRGADAVDQLPGGRLWRDAVEQEDAERRHLVIHEGHLASRHRSRPARGRGWHRPAAEDVVHRHPSAAA